MEVTTVEKDHAKANAFGWSETIEDWYTRINDENYEEIEQEVQEAVLCVSIRSGWESLTSEYELTPSEFKIELSTGGPALRIVGNLNMNQQPKNPVMEHQDWGTPWIRYAMNEEALEWFVNLFCFEY